MQSVASVLAKACRVRTLQGNGNLTIIVNAPVSSYLFSTSTDIHHLWTITFARRCDHGPITLLLGFIIIFFNGHA